MARDLTRKQLKKDEFVEAAFNIEQWVEDHWRKLAVWAGAAVGVVLVVIAATWWNESRRERANERLATGIEQFREAVADPAGSFEQALPALEQSQKSGGNVGWLGGYYRAAALIHSGSPQQAAEILGDLVGRAPNRELEQAARAMSAQAAIGLGRVEDAVGDLRAIADDGGPYAPLALITLGHLLAEQGRGSEAKEAYRSLIQTYPQDALAEEARQALEDAGS